MDSLGLELELLDLEVEFDGAGKQGDVVVVRVVGIGLHVMRCDAV